MYDVMNSTACLDGNLGPISPVIARFESWLKSHGYEPRDPFIPADFDDPEADCAAELVGEYLRDRPSERTNHNALLRYALENGEFAPAWGDNSGGFAFVCVSDGDNISLVA